MRMWVRGISIGFFLRFGLAEELRNGVAGATDGILGWA